MLAPNCSEKFRFKANREKNETFFLLMLSIWQHQIKIYIGAMLAGSVIGVLILAPSYDYINQREQNADPLSSLSYVLRQLKSIVMGDISYDNLML